MAILKTCCCWSDLRLASLAAGMFTLVTSSLQILLALTVFIGLSKAVSLVAVQEVYYFVLTGLDGLLVIFSALVLGGVELNERGRRLMVPWLILLPIYVIYEAAVNIFFFSKIVLTQDLSLAFSTVVAFLLIPLLYWITKVVLNVFGFLSVLSHYQQIQQIFKDQQIIKTRKPLTCYSAYPSNNYSTANCSRPIKIPIPDYPINCERCKSQDYCKCHFVNPTKYPGMEEGYPNANGGGMKLPRTLVPTGYNSGYVNTGFPLAYSPRQFVYKY